MLFSAGECVSVEESELFAFSSTDNDSDNVGISSRFFKAALRSANTDGGRGTPDAALRSLFIAGVSFEFVRSLSADGG